MPELDRRDVRRLAGDDDRPVRHDEVAGLELEDPVPDALLAQLQPPDAVSERARQGELGDQSGWYGLHLQDQAGYPLGGPCAGR